MLECCGLVFGQNTKKASTCDYLICRGYFSLGSAKLDPEVIRNFHPRPILAFSKAAELGQGSFLERKGYRIREHNGPVYKRSTAYWFQTTPSKLTQNIKLQNYSSLI
jgi:hypothetical protein